jgi:hypothetical protein
VVKEKKREGLSRVFLSFIFWSRLYLLSDAVLLQLRLL